jgi:hypothetical protein
VPGRGNSLRRVLRYEIPQRDRFPRGQDGASYGRLGTGAQAAGGKRLGTSGTKLGNAHRTWAFSEAAPLFRRGHEPGPKALARLENKQDPGKALRSLAPNLARAVYVMLTRQTAGDLGPGLRSSGRRAGAPGAELDPAGRSLHRTDVPPRIAASWNAAVRLGPLALSPAR